MSVTFYNAGDKIDEVFPYSITSGQDVHVTAKWHLQAPREEFFEVPTEIEIPASGETIAVQFQRDIPRKFGVRGVIKVDAKYDASKEDAERPIWMYPFASTREGAIARGREIWQEYLRSVVQSHLNDCESARAAGGAPKSAVGFTKRAMKLLGIADPGEQYFRSLQNGGAGDSASSDPRLSALQGQVAVLTQLLLGQTQGKPVDPAEIAKLAQAATLAAPAASVGVTSGVATGEIKKPLGNGEYRTATQQPRSRQQRAAAAVAELGTDGPEHAV